MNNLARFESTDLERYILEPYKAIKEDIMYNYMITEDEANRHLAEIGITEDTRYVD